MKFSLISIMIKKFITFIIVMVLFSACNNHQTTNSECIYVNLTTYLSTTEAGYLDENSKSFEIISDFALRYFKFYNERYFEKAYDIFFMSEFRREFRDFVLEAARETPIDVITYSDYMIHSIRSINPHLFLIDQTFTIYNFLDSNHVTVDFKQFVISTDENRLFLIDQPWRDIPHSYRYGLENEIEPPEIVFGDFTNLD